ncbi:UDP-glucose/GDP-mannose dehydrogenase family protein [Candidatus Babeliales bacterium]|nr:UDP-glucose/GDP-mannose dehydrogenase family protein [Candidatus Babeliales bacterium]MCF7899751.1 UDP-glucose/GDP-mannose dehydrogenase family protein [Candidatus Babeliales bacterium]
MRKIAVVGAGYVGLVTGACFAQKDNFIIIVERDQNKIENLLQGKIPFYEPGLDLLVSKAIDHKKIIFVDNLKQALNQKPEIIFSCVGTPSLSNGAADLSAVWGVVKEIGQNLTDYCLIVNKSTVPVGTAAKVKEIIKQELIKRNLDINFDVASNPEFLKEGDALDDFLQPDRVVVGVETEKAEQILFDLYKPFLNSSEQFLSMNWPSAELTKYASNSMLATRISFMNQLALLADKLGADINQVKLGMSKDRRIGSCFLNAGIGYGGSCFPKDVQALVYTGCEYDQEMSLIKEVENINNKQRLLFADQILNYFGDNILNKNIAIWGLAFKPETDDIRCAPSIDIINKLLEKKVKITAYDPVAWQNIKNIFGDKIGYANTSKEILSKSDFLIILTEWKEFLEYKPQDFACLKDKIVFDGRNCFNPLDMQDAGIKYFSIGRNSLNNFNQKICLENFCDQKENSF